MLSVKVNDFCVMQDDSFVQYGVEKGDLVFIAGDHLMQIDKDDPYVFRRVFIGAYVVGTSVDTSRQPFLVDGKRLVVVDSKLQEELYEQYTKDFEEAVDETPN